MRKKKIISRVYSSAVLTASFALNCYAETTQEQNRRRKKAEQKETQADYQNAQKNVERICREKRDDEEAYTDRAEYADDKAKG